MPSRCTCLVRLNQTFNTLSLNPLFFPFSFHRSTKLFSNSFPLLIFDRQSFTRVPIFGTPFQPIW
jgi:hypothetical protein